MAANTLNNNVLPTVNSPRWLNITDLEGEKWVDIDGFQGKYQISNYGRVKSKNKAAKECHFHGRRLRNKKGAIGFYKDGYFYKVIT